MDWPAIEDVTADLSLPPGATIRYIARADVEALPALILRWYSRVAVGAESVFLQHAFLRSRIALAERRGFQLYGSVPGFERDQVNPGVTRRVTEALFGKLLVSLEECEAPARNELTLSTRKLADAIGIATR